ncbi:glutamate formimidoyltransferase [Elusimicrobiota bacterium]
MLKLIECVPNFSEGRDKSVINEIVKAAESGGAQILDVDPGEDTNRTVVTIVGTPENVVESAFAAIKKASELIDMTKHKGAHPRMGATDVCPFVPVSGATMEDCAKLAAILGERVARELGIPVYLYEHAAKRPGRKNLAVCRKGEYEGLKEREGKPEMAPDFGENKFNPKSGATAIGAREFLIAYNVSLNTMDKKAASDIACSIRESGRVKRVSNPTPYYNKGEIFFDKKGKKVMLPGTFSNCKAVGWTIPAYNRSQISINLTNYKITPIHIVLEECRKQAAERGLIVTGSEVVGLIPLEAMLMAGRFYIEKQGKSPAASEGRLVECAVQSMGLRDVGPFDPSQKIIEYRFRTKKPLASMTQREFLDELASESPAPGGGSVAALAGGLSAGLSAMVAGLTYDNPAYSKVRKEMGDVGLKAQALKDALIEDIDRDTEAFLGILSAMRSGGPDQEDAVEEATKGAAQVPLEVLRRSLEATKLAKIVAEKGFEKTLSDGGVAAACARAAADGAFLNVAINLESIKDDAWNKKTMKEALKLKDEVFKLTDDVRHMVYQKLKVEKAKSGASAS